MVYSKFDRDMCYLCIYTFKILSVMKPVETQIFTLFNDNFEESIHMYFDFVKWASTRENLSSVVCE